MHRFTFPSFTWLLRRAALWIVPLIAAGSPVGRAAAESPELNSPAEVWRGYDPTAEPLEIESTKRWDEDGLALEKLRFTSETVEGHKVRVFTMQGAPRDAKQLPGVLHIHGGGQTASLDWVRFWTKRGYVCVTFDFCGPWADRTEVTDWGPLKQGNMQSAAGGYQVDPSVRASSWYHWTVAARRALTVLAQHPAVDANRLGIFGISMGGTLTWMVAGSDPRVKAAAPIYGCGYNLDRRKTRWGFPELTSQQAHFQRAMSSEAHAPYVTCPVLFLNATNDFHGWLDNATDTLAATPGPRWQTYTPSYNHHIGASEAASLPLWMDVQLKGEGQFPASPSLRLEIAPSGLLTGFVDAQGATPQSIEIFYALGDRPAPNHCWRRIACAAGQAHAELPVVDTWDTVFAFAKVTYPGDFSLSSPLVSCVPAQRGKATATLAASAPMDPQQVAQSWVYGVANTDPTLLRRYVLIDQTSERGPVVRQNPEYFHDTIHVHLVSHLLAEPQGPGRPDQALTFDCAGALDDQGLTVTVTQNDWTPLAKRYRATVPQSQLKGPWTTVTLPLSSFATAEGEHPQRWNNLDKLELQGKAKRDAPFELAKLRWESAPAAPVSTPAAVQ